MLKRFICYIFSVSASIALCCANVVIPLMVVQTSTLFLLLIPIILIEAGIYAWAKKSSLKSFFWSTTWANIVSSLVWVALFAFWYYLVKDTTLFAYPTTLTDAWITWVLNPFYYFGPMGATMSPEEYAYGNLAQFLARLTPLVVGCFLSIWIEHDMLRKKDISARVVSLAHICSYTLLTLIHFFWLSFLFPVFMFLLEFFGSIYLLISW